MESLLSPRSAAGTGYAMGSSRWGAATEWYIDPAGTSGGNDANDGAASLRPIKSIAEFRRRMAGADISSVVPIYALSGSSNPDDGLFCGFSTTGSAGRIVIIATPTVIGGGTLTAGTTSGYSGNLRAQVVDSSLPDSWTASYGITTTSESRYIARVGGAGNCIAPILLDQGSKTAMIGLATSTSETSTASPTATITNFSVGDTYVVETRPAWPTLASFGCRVRLQNFDVFPALFQGHWTLFDQYSLCGFTTNAITDLHLPPTGVFQYFNCVFAATVAAQVGNWVPLACSFLAGLQVAGCYDWGSTDNVFLGNGSLGTAIKLFSGSIMGSGIGTQRIFDSSGPLISVSDGSKIALSSVVGSNNTGSLCQAANGGRIIGASRITATTSKSSPYTTNGVDYASPPGEDSSGSAIYS